MKKEQILDLINTIPPDLVEEADVQLPVKRRMPKLARAGLIAACLCLALIGTAAAANYFGVRLVDKNNASYMQGGIAYVPYDSLSEELRTIIEEADGKVVTQSAPSWQAAEALIGIDLMNNPVLDAASAHNHYIISNGVKGCFLVASDRYEIRTNGRFELGDVDIGVESHIFTEYRKDVQEDWDETFSSRRFSDNSEVSQDTYTAPSGLTAQILLAHTPRTDFSDSFYCYGSFSLNGIPTVVECESNTSMEEARTTLYQILDGFILS